EPGNDVIRDNLLDVLMRQQKAEEASNLVTETLTSKGEETWSFQCKRGRSLAVLGHWKEAAQNLNRAIEIDHDDQQSSHELTLILFHDGQLKDYRELCRKRLEQFAQTQVPRSASQVALDSLMLPLREPDLTAAAALAETAFK